MKPHAPATERNREPILAQLERRLPRPARVLEIGSGTGQHAVFFGARLPHVQWQTSDRSENLPGIRQWVEEAALPNVLPPLELDVLEFSFERRYDAVFSANTLHIMPWNAVCAMIEGIGKTLDAGGLFLVYGPFMRDGRISAPSNVAFNASLKAQAPHMGLRDVSDLEQLARRAGMVLQDTQPMPANNELLVWQKGEGARDT